MCVCVCVCVNVCEFVCVCEGSMYTAKEKGVGPRSITSGVRERGRKSKRERKPEK